MEKRGVTRHMARRAVDRELEKMSGEDGHPNREQRLRAHHRQVLWIPWVLVLLGVWQVLAPATLGYRTEELWAVPSGGRGVWFSEGTRDALRASLMTWSSVVSGALLVVLGWRALRPDRPVAWWGACFVGIWLVFAPVVLWSPTASGYVNDSLVGVLVIALTVLLPGMPNMPAFMMMGPPTPPGWTYNPSSWPQRAVLIALAFVGLVISRYLGAYQLGYIDRVWDPFFGFSGGTGQVLDSDLSHTWPISDAALGGIAYSFEFLMGFMGSAARWRTMPWMVALFGILVIPLGLSHVALIVSMPVVVHAWCTLCLLAGLVMLPMVTLTFDEVVAMGQHVRQAARRGDRGGSLWKVFWLGGQAEGSTPDERSPDMMDLPERPLAVVRSSLWGASAPMTLITVAALGAWLYAAPGVFGVGIRSGAADLAHLGGAFVVVIAVVAMAEVVRALRLLNVAAGIAIAAIVFLTGAEPGYAAVVVVTGAAVAALSLPRGAIRESYGTWSRAIR